MPWTAPIIGYVDGHGYLRCTWCASPEQKQVKMYGDNGAMENQLCDVCKHPFKIYRTSEYVQISHDAQEAPEERQITTREARAQEARAKVLARWPEALVVIPVFAEKNNWVLLDRPGGERLAAAESEDAAWERGAYWVLFGLNAQV
jgi:hypothetical protein